MWRSCLFFLTIVCWCQGATRITYPGCDRSGWKCIKVQASPIRYLIEYACQNNDGVSMVLWNFNAPAEIKELRVVNCTSLEIDLTCTGVGRMIEKLHVNNVGVLNFTSLVYSDVAQMPEVVIFENIKSMPLISEKTFKQMKYPLASAYRCAVNTKPVDQIHFSNINIGTIAQNAFFNLTEVKKFVWDNVKIERMEPLALQASLLPSTSFSVTNCSFKHLDYKAFYLRSPVVKFVESSFDELPRNVIDSTSFQFDFINNTVQKVHSFAFILLSQDITFEHNEIQSLKTSALQGIGPGLLENAFMSFGQLRFTYNFNKNTIQHSDIGGLHPDWIAYKNVRSFLNVTLNRLPCSCKELGWITLRSGLGEEFSAMMTFNSKYLDKNNNNVCLNSPCDLPVTVMVGMNIKFGLCGTPVPLLTWCKKYKSNSTKDFGFNTAAKVVLNKWQNDFLSMQSPEEETIDDVDALEDMYALAQKTENVYSDAPEKFIKYSKGHPKESYFKIEKSGLFDIDPISIINQVTDSNHPTEEISEPYTNSPVTYLPDIVFKDDASVNQNGTLYKYNIDVRNNNQNSTKPDAGFLNLKKEYEDNQKDFIRKTYDQWQAQRKKRMVYFKVYGNLLTVE